VTSVLGRAVARRARNLVNRLRTFSYRFGRILLCCFRPSEPICRELLYCFEPRLGVIDWIFHDERWERVVRRFEQREALFRGQAVTADDSPQFPTDEICFGTDGTLMFSGITISSDEWLYLHLDPERFQWKDFSWQFEVRRLSAFRELQFGFRYQDFYNRYRYRFENDCVWFDLVVNGQFYNGLSATPFRMKIGEWYRVRIDAVGRLFRLYVNGDLISIDYDINDRFSDGPVAMILWEDDGLTNIQAEVRSLTVYRLA